MWEVGLLEVGMSERMQCVGDWVTGDWCEWEVGMSGWLV